MFVDAIVVLAAFYLFGFGVFTILEVLAPRQQMLVTDRLRGLKFAAVSIPLIAGCSVGMGAATNWLGVEPIIRLQSPVQSVVVAAILAALWTDFIFYWFHRFQHRFLWRFHAVHHSIRNVTAINAYHHWTEPLFLALITGPPLALVTADFGPPLFALILVFRYQAFFIHSPTRLHFGPLSKILIDNRYHRIHHSLQPEHHDRNFGAMTPLWDWLFGTLYVPATGEWPEVGLAFVDEPRNMSEWESLPRRLRKGSVRTGGVKLAPPGFMQES